MAPRSPVHSAPISKLYRMQPALLPCRAPPTDIQEVIVDPDPSWRTHLIIFRFHTDLPVFGYRRARLS